MLSAPILLNIMWPHVTWGLCCSLIWSMYRPSDDVFYPISSFYTSHEMIDCLLVRFWDKYVDGSGISHLLPYFQEVICLICFALSSFYAPEGRTPAYGLGKSCKWGSRRRWPWPYLQVLRYMDHWNSRLTYLALRLLSRCTSVAARSSRYRSDFQLGILKMGSNGLSE